MEGATDRLEAGSRWYLEALDALGDDKWRRSSRCAGWTAANVVAHVVGGDYLTRAVVYNATGRDRSMLAALPTDMGERVKLAEAMAGWEPAKLRERARTESHETVSALGEVLMRAPDTVLRMPYGEAPAGNVARVRAWEYIIHGYDLQPATGWRQPVPAWYVDSALPVAAQMMTRTHQRSPHTGKAASFHLHRTDGEGEWILRAEGGQAQAVAGHDRADVALRGPAEGLYWVLMGRGRPEEHGVEVHGDSALAAAFKEWFPGP